jgi:hypothetical protein
MSGASSPIASAPWRGQRTERSAAPAMMGQSVREIQEKNPWSRDRKEEPRIVRSKEAFPADP